MSWFSVLKMPMVVGADGKKQPMRSSDIEREAEYELKLKELDRRLNEYDLDVTALKIQTGEIDPSIRRTIADKHGESKEVFSESPRGSSKYLWRGLRLITERPMGSGKLSELREKFPEWHVTLVRKTIQEDTTNEYPDAVEYFFSPRKETIASGRMKYPNKPRKYGKHQRTMQQYQRFLEEGKKLALLDADENVVQDKFKKYFTGRIKEMFSQEVMKNNSLSAYRVRGFEESLKQFTPDIPEEHEAYKGRYKDSENLKESILSNERLVLEALQTRHNEKMLEHLNRESTINSLIVYFSGGETMDRLVKRYYEWVRKSLQYELANAIAQVKKDPTWVDAEEMNRMADAIKQRSEKQERHSRLNESQIRRPRSISPQRWQRMTPAQRHNSQFRKSLEWFNQLIGVKE
mgnify:FL=1